MYRWRLAYEVFYEGPLVMNDTIVGYRVRAYKENYGSGRWSRFLARNL